MDAITWLGVVGAAVILLAFILNQLEVWSRQSFVYDFANLVGAALLVIYAYLINSYPFLVLNVVWFGVSLRDVMNHARPRKK